MAINDQDNNGEIDFVEFLHLVANIEAKRNTIMEGELIELTGNFGQVTMILKISLTSLYRGRYEAIAKNGISDLSPLCHFATNNEVEIRNFYGTKNYFHIKKH